MSEWYRLEGKTTVPAGRFAGMQSAAERTVAKTTVSPETEVSTVFLALDHAMPGQAPQLFETMVFGGPLDQEQDRYATWDEAAAGHQAWVERAKIADTAALSLAWGTEFQFECGKCHTIHSGKLGSAVSDEPGLDVRCRVCGTAYRLAVTMTIAPLRGES